MTATGGRLQQGDPKQAISGVSIDSRTIGSGDLFIAIRGDRFDGHDFIGAAMARGSVGVIVETGRVDAARTVAQGRQEFVIVSVPDTTRGLQDIARDVRRRAGTKVVAITGSAGKTTTKEVAAEFLSTRFRVFRNKGNLNNHIGLPLSLLELRSRPEIAVVELGMNHPGEIRTLVHVAEPGPLAAFVSLQLRALQFGDAAATDVKNPQLAVFIRLRAARLRERGDGRRQNRAVPQKSATSDRRKTFFLGIHNFWKSASSTVKRVSARKTRTRSRYDERVRMELNR